MRGSRTRPTLRAVAVLSVLSLAGSGCWLQRGFDAGRTRFVTGDAPITQANAGQLVELWRATGLGNTVLEPVVLGGDVYVTAGSSVARVSAATGAVAYVRTLTPPAGAVSFDLSAPIHHDGELDVGWNAVRSSGSDTRSAGGLARLVPATGELIEPLADEQFGLATNDLAEEHGTLVREKFAGVFLSPSFGQRIELVDWRGILASTGLVTGLAGFAPSSFAVAGDHLVFGNAGVALGWNGTTCSNPDPDLQLPGQPPGCLADWQTPLGTTLSGPAALGTDAAVYGVDTNRIAVLDAATGAVRFIGTIPGSPPSPVTAPAVAGDTILVGARDGRIAAFPAAGCGQADCAPLWQTTIGTTMGAAPTVVGDVVYATTANQLVTLPLAGCGAATCPPIATYDIGAPVWAVAYDGGRIFVATTNGQVVAFGLPPT